MSVDENSVNSKYDGENLSELFNNAFQLFEDIMKSNEPSNGSKTQCDIRRTMKMLEDATKLVSLVDMFSVNESFEEVSTENLKYFLLPALLGTLTTKLCGIDDRIQVVDIAEIYFVDYLKRLKDYGLIDMDIPEIKNEEEEASQQVPTTEQKSNAELITEMINKRNTKIQRYKEYKDLEKRLELLKHHLESPNISDEDKREYFTTLLKMYVNQAIDELSSLAAEKPLLRHMKMIRSSEGETHKAHRPKIPPPPLKPIIITRDSFQKQVYGAGYPSLPVLTVEEFYEKKIQDGEWLDPSQRNKLNNTCLQDTADNEEESNRQQELEDEETENKIEEDDPEYLAKTRAMDEYKDTHRRGWGNRANRS